ncbi:MAG: ankyrin repeat domain-containing protein [Rhizomicrobium sp.]|jgi:ankyrin repeat protein
MSLGTMDVKSLFALADADDAAGLLRAMENSAVPPVNENGETPYLYCTYRGKATCVEALAKRGNLTLQEAAAAGDVARIDACLAFAPWTVQTLSGDGWTALHLAAFLGRDDAVARLLDRGGNARQWGRAMDSNLAIHAACAGRKLGKTAFTMLIAATGDPDIAQKAGYTALMIAAANGFADAVDALLAAGADRSRKTPEGKTAGDFARERGHGDLASLLG